MRLNEEKQILPSTLIKKIAGTDDGYDVDYYITIIQNTLLKHLGPEIKKYRSAVNSMLTSYKNGVKTLKSELKPVKADLLVDDFDMQDVFSAIFGYIDVDDLFHS